MIRREGLKDESELQSYFIRRMEQFINSKGRRMIGWDEILEGGLAPDATVMSWRGEDGGIAAARQGHDVIMTPDAYLYFDHYQGDRAKEPLAIGGMLPLDKVYSYNPMPAALNAEEQKHILGAQANVWTEYIADPHQVEYMLFPRLFALAEVVWSPQAQRRKYPDFLQRVPPQLARLKRQGVNYRPLTSYSIRSERLLIEQLDYNLLFRWFVGMSMDERMWVPTVFTKNRERLLKHAVAQSFFERVLALAQPHLSDEHFTVDGTLIEAWASQKSFRRKDGNDDGDGANFHGQQRRNDTHQSTTDPDAKLYRKSNHAESKLSYLGHTLVENRSGMIVGTYVTQADGHAERDAALLMLCTSNNATSTSRNGPSWRLRHPANSGRAANHSRQRATSAAGPWIRNRPAAGSVLFARVSAYCFPAGESP